MNIDPQLQDVADKVEAGVRLDFDDGMLLSTHPDVLTVGQIANGLRERLHGNVTYYNRNLHLNATNICEASCSFCSFARLKEGMPSAYTMSQEQALKWIEERYRPGMTEVHIVNGLNPDLPFGYYTGSAAGDPRAFSRLAPEGVHGGGNPLLRREVRHELPRSA